ncbi:MAG: hypothetical protein ED557_14740 [Balneola sp.]|nr:MAG: hypothetical protein ED557_14740 [Balneola sp.]
MRKKQSNHKRNKLEQLELPLTRIDRNAIKAWRITGFFTGLLLYLIPGFTSIFYFKEDSPLWITLVAIVLALSIHILLTVVFPKVRWNRWSYDVSEQAVDLHRGIIIQTRTVVPINRIQHVDTKKGPIYRRFGLSSISISTAATTHEIPALDDNTASEMRTLISELVRKVKEDV